MSTEDNVQLVKNFFAAMAAATRAICWRWLPKISSGSFRAKAGRWQARTAGTRS